MAVYAYKAMNAASSTPVAGTVTADTPRQARDQLRAQGLAVLQIAAQKTSLRFSKLPALRLRKRNTAAVTSFLRELSTLLSVGVPMLEAIDTVVKQHQGGFRTVLLMLRERVASGTGLAEALREHPDEFDALCVSITEVGEDSGTLESSLERLAGFRERSLQLKNRVVTALVYPCLVLATGVLVSVFLMTFVVPNLLATLLEAGRPLPMATRVVKAISDGMVYGWWVILLAVVAVILAITYAARSEKFRHRWDRWVLNMPLVGDMTRKQAISRIALTISTLIKSGVVFERAVQIAANATRNTVLRQALEHCKTSVRSGREISTALEESGCFPPLVVRVFAAGQNAGRLDEMLDRLHHDYEQQVTTASQRLTSILEPALILVLAVIVGFIAFATFMPILEAGDVL